MPNPFSGLLDSLREALHGPQRDSGRRFRSIDGRRFTNGETAAPSWPELVQPPTGRNAAHPERTLHRRTERGQVVTLTPVRYKDEQPEGDGRRRERRAARVPALATANHARLHHPRQRAGFRSYQTRAGMDVIRAHADTPRKRAHR